MVKALEKIALELEKLPKDKQEALTESWLDEIHWEMRFENSQKELAKLVNEALGEYTAGNTKDL